MRPLRAISVRNPWAAALVLGHKPVENRDWPLPQWARGELVLVHCGLAKPTREEIATVVAWAEERRVSLPPWALRPVAGIVGALVFDGDVTVPEVSRGREWAFGERCWLVREGSTVAFREPIRCSGALGFFEPDRQPKNEGLRIEEAARAALARPSYTAPKRPPMTDAKLRRRVEAAVHDATGDVDTWPGVVRAMREHLGRAMGMTPAERWDRMGPVELELLAEALEERTAIQGEGRVAS